MSHGLLGPFPICRCIGLAIHFPPIPLRCHCPWYSKLYIADWFCNPFTMLPWPLTVWCVASWCGGFELSNRNQIGKGKQNFQSCKIMKFELNSILPSPNVCSACSVCGVYLRLSERAKSERGLIKWSSSAVRVKHLRNIQRHFSSLTNSPEANKNGVSRNSRRGERY